MVYMANVSKQFHQLPMFMTGAELAALHSGDFGRRVSDVSPEDFDNAHGVGMPSNDHYREGHPDHASYMKALTQSVEDSGGIEEKAHVWLRPGTKDTLVDGHHRAKVAEATNRLVPVEHHEGDIDNVHTSVFLKKFDWGNS